MADDVKQRGIDLLTPVYNMLDLTPQGRKADGESDVLAKIAAMPEPVATAARWWTAPLRTVRRHGV